MSGALPSRAQRQAALAACLAALLAAGCAEADRAPAPEGEAWRLGEPRVSIGVLEGDERYELMHVAAGWKDAAGRIIIVDASPHAVRIFDPSGAFLHRFASRGQGPGEVGQAVNGFPYRGDSIAVVELVARRVTVFDSRGRFGRRVHIPVQYQRRPGTVPSQSCCQVTGALADGSFIVHPPDEIPNEPGPPRHATFTLLRAPADGASVDTLGTFASREYYYDPAAPSNIRSYQAGYPFLYAVGGDVVIGGNGESAALVVVRPGRPGEHPGGPPVDTLHLPAAREPFTREVQEAYERAYLEGYERRPAFFHARPTFEREYVEDVPVHTFLHLDEAGRLWAAQWSLPFSVEPVRYRVYSQDGAALGSIQLPAGSRLLWAGEDEALLLERDDLDVESVRLYPILRGMPEGS